MPKCINIYYNLGKFWMMTKWTLFIETQCRLSFNCVLCFQFVSVAGFFVNLIGIVSFRHNHSHHGHSHSASATQSHGSPSSHVHSHVSSHSHAAAAACSTHSHAEHSHAVSLPSSPAVTHNTNMEGSHHLCLYFSTLSCSNLYKCCRRQEQMLETFHTAKMSNMHLLH